MRIKPRTFRGKVDIIAMIQLARQCQSDTLHWIDLPYRLSSWALDEPGNVGLWVDEAGSLAAWAVMQTPFWCMDYCLRPDVEGIIHPQLLDWIDRRARESCDTRYDLPAWYVNVFADQSIRREMLERHGFTDQGEAGEDAWSKVWMQLEGETSIPQYALPRGFTLRPLAGKSEVQAHVELHRAVFGTRNMTVEWRRRMLSHPDYLPELDMVVAAPDGRPVSYCIGWIGRNLDGDCLGQIEPLGCHVDFRRYALGRTVLCETLRLLQQRGAKYIYVETDNYRDTAFRLYESLGFKVSREVKVYGKGYNQVTG